MTNGLDRSGPVVGLGQASLDFLGLIPGYPPPDAKCELQSLAVQGGGPAATALVALARLGMPTAFIGVVGDDGFGEQIRRGLADEKVDLAGLIVRPGGESQFAFIAVDPGTAQRTIFWHPGQGTGLDPDEVDLNLVRRARLLHLDGLKMEACLLAAGEARRAGVPVVLDAGTLRDRYLELAALTDHLVCSEKFFRAFQPDGDLETGLQRLHEIGPGYVVVTLGSQGSAGYDGREFHHCPAFPVRAVDTTGAGDAFHGGYIFALLQGWAMPGWLTFASAVAALKCEHIGGRTGLPTLERVRDFLGSDYPGI